MVEIPQAALRARQMYADGELLTDILAETKLTLDRAYYWFDGGGGQLPPIPRRRTFGRGEGKARARRAMIGRMMRAADHKMQQIEARMQSAPPSEEGSRTATCANWRSWRASCAT